MVGSGTPAALGDEITVNYIGVACSTGKIFDSSWQRGQPATFPLQEGGLIQGWTQGIPGMQPGGRRLLSDPAGSRLRRDRPGHDRPRRDAHLRRRPGVGRTGDVDDDRRSLTGGRGRLGGRPVSSSRPARECR